MVDKTLRDNFDKVIAYSQNIAQKNLHTDNLFTLYSRAKQQLYYAMGKQLIIEYPELISIKMNDDLREQSFNHFLDYITGEFSRFNIATIVDFLYQNREGFFENKTVNPYVIGNETIPCGMKLGKALKTYFSSYVDEATMQFLIVEMSRMVQNNKVTGTLCLSIHPLDFLSASENTYNWRSCHALDGEYRCGNLSYMCDSCTVMAYIKGDNYVKLPHFPEDVLWNSKKWRCFFHIDFNNGLIHAGRQYPWFNEQMLALVQNLLLKPYNYLDVNFSYSWNSGFEPRVFKTVQNNDYTMRLNERHMTYGGTIHLYSDFVVDAENSFHYNDLLKSSVYLPWVLQYKRQFEACLKSPMIVGEEVPCLICGEQHIFDSDCVACLDCIYEQDLSTESILTCEWCDRRAPADDMHEYQGEIICDACYRNAEDDDDYN